MVSTGYGDFILPLCTTPQAQPVAASLVFVSFAILGGYVMISMCLAAVAIGINERLQALRKQAVYGGDVGGEAAGQGLPPRVGLEGIAGGAKVSKLTGNVKEKALMKALLFKAWNTETGSMAGSVRVPGMNRQQSMRVKANTTITRPNLEISGDKEGHIGAMDNALFMHTLLNSKYHDAAISCLIALDACLQIGDEGKVYTLGSYVTHVVVQVLLFIDLGSFVCLFIRSQCHWDIPSHLSYYHSSHTPYYHTHLYFPFPWSYFTFISHQTLSSLLQHRSAALRHRRTKKKSIFNEFLEHF